jgi:hypothetical protein
MNSPYIGGGGAPSFGVNPGMFASANATADGSSRNLAAVLQFFSDLATRSRQENQAANTADAFRQNMGGGGGPQQPAQPSAMAALVAPPATGMDNVPSQGGDVSGNGVDMKKFAAAAKLADATRSVVAMNTPSLPDQQPKVLGYTDDEWKHLGTLDKMAAYTGFTQAQTAKAQMQAYDKATADVQEAHARAGYYTAHAAQASAMTESTANENNAWQRFGQNYNAATAPTLNAGANGMQMFANAAAGNSVTPGPQLNGQQMQDLALRSGVNARDAQQLAKGQMELDKGTQDLAQAQKATAGAGAGKIAPPPSILTLKDDDGNKYHVLHDPTTGKTEFAPGAPALTPTANVRLTQIGKALADMDKYLSSTQLKDPVNIAKRQLLEEEQQSLLGGAQGGAAPAAPANNNDPLGLFGK